VRIIFRSCGLFSRFSWSLFTGFPAGSQPSTQQLDLAANTLGRLSSEFIANFGVGKAK
jgi:hypothetical protein